MRRRWKIILATAFAVLLGVGLLAWWYVDRTIIGRIEEQKGFEAWQRGDHALAEEKYSNAIRKFPSDSHDIAQTLAYRAGNRVTLKRYDDALTDADSALRIEPSNHLALTARGRALYHLGRYDDAKADLDRSLKLHEQSAVAHYYRALVAERQGNFDLANSHYVNTITQNGPLARAHAGIGRALRAMGLVDQAEEYFKRARELNPKVPLEIE